MYRSDTDLIENKSESCTLRKQQFLKFSFKSVDSNFVSYLKQNNEFLGFNPAKLANIYLYL